MNKNINILLIILITIIVIYLIYNNFNKKEKFTESVCGPDDRTFIDDTIINFCNELCNDPDICAGTQGLQSTGCLERKQYCESRCPTFAREKIIEGGKIAGHYITKAIVYDEIYNNRNINFIGENWILVKKQDFIDTVGTSNANNIGDLELDLKNKLNSGQLVFTKDYIDSLDNQINLFSYVDKVDTLSLSEPMCYIVNRSIEQTNTVLGDKFRTEFQELQEVQRVVSEQNALIIKINQALQSISETASCNVEASAKSWNNLQNNIVPDEYEEYVNIELGNLIKEKNGELLQSDIDSLSTNIDDLKYNHVVKVFTDDDVNFNYWRPVLPKRLENYIKIGNSNPNDYQIGDSINSICTNSVNGYSLINDGADQNMIKNIDKDKYLSDSKVPGTKWKLVDKTTYLNAIGSGIDVSSIYVDLKNKLNNGQLIFTKEYIEGLGTFDVRSYILNDNDLTKVFIVDFNKMYYSLDDIISERVSWNQIVNGAIQAKRSSSASECAYTKDDVKQWGNQLTVPSIGVFGKIGNIKVLDDSQQYVDNPDQYSRISDYQTARDLKQASINDCLYTNSESQNLVNSQNKIVRESDSKEWVKQVSDTDLQSWETSSFPTDKLTKQYIHKDIVNSKQFELDDNQNNCKYTYDDVRNWKGSPVKSTGVTEIIPSFGTGITERNYGLLGDNTDNYKSITEFAKLTKDINDVDTSCAYLKTQVDSWTNSNKPVLNINGVDITYGLIGSNSDEYAHRQTILNDYNNNCAYKKIIPDGQTDSTTYLYKTSVTDSGTEIDLNTQDTLSANGNTWGKFDNTLSLSSTVDDIKTNSLPYVKNEIIDNAISGICKASQLDDGVFNKYARVTDKYGVIGTGDDEYRTMGSCDAKKQSDLDASNASYQALLGVEYAPIKTEFDGYTSSESEKWNKLLGNQRKIKNRILSMKQVCDDNTYQTGEADAQLNKKQESFYRSIKFIEDSDEVGPTQILIENSQLSQLLIDAPSSQDTNKFVDTNNIYHISDIAWNQLNPKVYSFTNFNYIMANGKKFRLARPNEFIPGLGNKSGAWNTISNKYIDNENTSYQAKKSELVDKCSVGIDWINSDQCLQSGTVNNSCIYDNYKTINQKDTQIENEVSPSNSWYTGLYTDGQTLAQTHIQQSANGKYFKLYGKEWIVVDKTIADQESSQYKNSILSGHKYNVTNPNLMAILTKLIEKDTNLPSGSLITLDYEDIIDYQNILKWNGYFELTGTSSSKYYIQINLGENCNECVDSTNKNKYINGILQTPQDTCEANKICKSICTNCDSSIGNSCRDKIYTVTQSEYDDAISQTKDLAHSQAKQIFLGKYPNQSQCVNYSYGDPGSQKLIDTCYDSQGNIDQTKECSFISQSQYDNDIQSLETRNQNYQDYCSTNGGSCSSMDLRSC